MQAASRRQADAGGKEQPVKRGDSGDQPGRGPGLEETPEQPAGPAAGLRRGAAGTERRTFIHLSLPGQGGTRRVVLTVRDERKVRCG